jgi:hypothetical protein
MYMAEAFSKGDQITLRLNDEFISGEVLASAVSGLGELIHLVKANGDPISWFPTSQYFFRKNQSVVVKTDDIPYIFGRVTGHELGASGHVEYKVALTQVPTGVELAFDIDAVFRTQDGEESTKL